LKKIVIVANPAEHRGFDAHSSVPYDEGSRIKIMRIAYLDCFSGMSGDMFLGALVDAGVPVRLLEETVAALNVGARLEISRVERSGISATKVDVYVGGEKELPREVYWEQKGHSHAHDHSQAPGHGHEHVQLREHNYSQESKESSPPTSPTLQQHEHGRGLKEIREIIRSSKIGESAKQAAIAIFETLGAAEAKIHNTEVEKIHFHEVGAVDAMVDIVCAAVGSEALAVDEFICSSLNVGGGTVNCSHGTFPIPAPATVELLKGAPVCSSGIQLELVTPTGAAIVKTLCKRFSSFPEMKIDKTGYGAGSRDLPGHANVVRLTIGEAQSEFVAKASEQIITVLEANIDDLNPQVFGYVMDRLLEEGALDAFGIPVQMKKNRPGMLLSVLCRPEDAPKLTNLILSETTTLGVRRREERREVLARKLVTVSTRWGDVRLKVASMNGTITNYAPEYDDCRRIAVEHHVPLKNVMQEAMQAYVKVLAKAG
jgi:uncharacterized protein (TIGR00299 family) protein